MSMKMPSQRGGAPEDGAGVGEDTVLSCRRIFETPPPPPPREGWEEVFPTHGEQKVGRGPSRAEELRGNPVVIQGGESKL